MESSLSVLAFLNKNHCGRLRAGLPVLRGEQRLEARAEPEAEVEAGVGSDDLLVLKLPS